MSERGELEKRLACVKQYAIYGAGVVAQNAYLLLHNLFLEKDFLGFFVTDESKDAVKSQMTEQMYHKPVRGIGQTEDILKDALIIVATSARYWDEIVEELKNLNLLNYVFLSYDERRMLFEKFYAAWFSEKAISVEGEWCVMQNEAEDDGMALFIRNPFLENRRNRNSCFSELGTIILPAVWHDNRLSSETPYEIEQVNLDMFCSGIVFDLGANQGYFGAVAAGKGHEVYMFEPSHNLISNLEKYREKYEGIHVIEAAVANCDGVGELNIDEYSDDANSLVLKTNYSGTEQVQLMKLDTFVEERNIKRVDFIKADIEGAEREMLKGAKHILQKYAPLLSICTYHLPDDPEVIKRIIMEANSSYRIIQKEKKLYAFCEREI